MKFKFLFILTLLSQLVYSQINIELKEDETKSWTLIDRQKLDNADKYFSNQEFLFARPIYDSLYKKHKSNIYIGYLLGSCSIFDPRYQVKSESLIKAASYIKSKLLDYDYYFKLTNSFIEQKLPEVMVVFDDILKKNDIMPIPETHTAWVQKASCNFKMIIL